MPRISKKRELELCIEKACRSSNNIMDIRKVQKEDEEESEDWNESSDLDYSTLHEIIQQSYSYVCNLRYMFRDKYRTTEKWYHILNDTLPGYNYSDTEFLSCFRMLKSSFFKLVDLLQNNDIFNKEQRPVEAQLLCFLYFYGTTDTNATKIGRMFGFGKGTVLLYKKRVEIAITSLKNSVISWPDENERQLISKRFFLEYKFPYCVGIIDGTYLLLRNKPELCGEDYITRKGGYGINCLIICDDQGKILYYVCGWAGATHDNIVWRNSKMFQNSQNYFNEMEYIIADSAYSPSMFLVPAFKRSTGEAVPDDGKYWFNTQLAKGRIKSEHCNGLLKGRWSILTNMNVTIRKPRDVKKVVKIFECCAILHNLMLDYGNEGDDEWYETAFEDVGGYDSESEFLSHPIARDANGDIRRNRIYNYLLEEHNFRFDN